MKVVVTGATGFIGVQVARALVEAGHDVAALVRPRPRTEDRLGDLRGRLSVIEGDLDDLGWVAGAGADVCVHLAWSVEPGVYLSSPANVDHLASTVRLARTLAAAGCRRFVATGTSFEYSQREGCPNEGSATGPTSLYAASKLSTFQLLTQLSALEGWSFAWPRIFYQYGPFESEKRLVPAVIVPLLTGGEARVTPGEQVRDFLHTEDVGRAVAAVTTSDVTGAVNVGSGVPCTIRELCLAIALRCGRPDRLHLGAIPYRPNEPMFLAADTTKLRSLGFRPRYDLAGGIDATVAWWRDRLRSAS